MEELDIINLWKAQNVKLEQSLAINRKVLTELQSYKAESAMRSFKAFKAWGIVAAVIYLVLLGSILFFAIAHYSSAANYFTVSMGAIFIINVKALADYIRHLVLANNIDFEGSIIDIQQKLNNLQLSIIQHTRIMYLQLPFWTTFCLSNKWFPQIGWEYIVFQVILTGSFTYLAYWLYKNQTIENADKKWFRRFISGSGGEQIRKALAFYQEMEEFKSEGVAV
jgi:hypothetical protein